MQAQDNSASLPTYSLTPDNFSESTERGWRPLPCHLLHRNTVEHRMQNHLQELQEMLLQTLPKVVQKTYQGRYTGSVNTELSIKRSLRTSNDFLK